MKEIIRAAIRDPETGKIYSGDSHAEILDELDDGDKALYRRMSKVYRTTGSLPSAKHVGFIGDDGVLLSRIQSQAKWGVFFSQDIKRL